MKIIFQKNNHENDINLNPLDGLTTDELSEWKIKIKASAWKSTQRNLMNKNKLNQYKIDSLNKLGMEWTPKSDRALLWINSASSISLLVNPYRSVSKSSELFESSE